MTIFAVGMLAAALSSPVLLPLAEPVEIGFPDYAATVQGFQARPPAWNEGLVNVGWGAAKGHLGRRDGWLRKHWVWLDAVDRSADSPSFGFLEQRGIFYDVYGYNEYQETIFFREEGALALLKDHGGIARAANGELLLHRRFSTDEQKQIFNRGNVYLMDHLDSRWSAIVGYDWLTSPLLGDGISQDNIGMTIPSGLTYGDHAGQMFRAHLVSTKQLPRFLKSGGSIRNYVANVFYPRAVREGGVGSDGNVDPDRVRDDRVLSAYYRFQVLANLYQFSQHYLANKLVASRAGRAYDVHGNQGGFVIGFNPYQVLLSDFVDSVWFESRGLSSRDLFEMQWSNAWGPFRFQMGDAMALGRKPVLIMARENGRGPALQAHAYAEASAGGGALMVGAHEVGSDPRSQKWLDSFFDFRDRNRALYELRGRKRHAQVAVVYSLPTFLWDHAVAVFDRPAMNDLGGVARAFEEGHVPYDVLILGMSEIRKDPFPSADLTQYKVIVLPSVSALSEAQVSRLEEFGRRGGTLVVLGDLGTRNERGRLVATGAREALRSSSFVRRPLGTASFRSSRKKEAPDFREQWRSVSDAVRKAVGTPLVEGNLPRWTWVKTWLHEEGLFSAHFVNYDFDFKAGAFRPTVPAQVSVRLPDLIQIEEVTWRVPGQPARPLAFERSPGGVSVLLPALDVYGVLVVGRTGAADRANALRRGDRYLLRARHAGKPLPGVALEADTLEKTRSRQAPAAYATAAKALLEEVATRREAGFLQEVESIADPGQSVLALNFGGKKAQEGWQPLGSQDAYNFSRGYGWLSSHDRSKPTPEEVVYQAAFKSKVDPDEIATGRVGSWPHKTPVPVVLQSHLYSGQRQRLRVDVPAGRYRVEITNVNPGGSRRNFFVSGATWVGEESVLLDVPINRNEWVRRSFTAVAGSEGLTLELGAATGWGVSALVVRRDRGVAEANPAESGAIRSWQLSPRHPNPTWAPLENLRPPARTDFGPVALAAWTSVRGPETGFPIIDLGTAVDTDPGDVVYAASLLERDQAERVRFHFGSTSSAEVWLNGERVASLPNVKGIQHNEAVVELSLQKGRNVLMLGMERFWERRWLFYGSLSAAD